MQQQIQISVPETGQTRIAVSAGQVVLFDFPLNAVSFEREGNDLILTFDNGSSTALDGAFAQSTEGNPPCFALPSGVVIAASVFLEMLESGDLATAASGCVAGSGARAYVDDAGTLVTGVDRLDALAGEAATAPTEDSPLPLFSAAPFAQGNSPLPDPDDGSGGNEGDNGGEDPEPPVPPIDPPVDPGDGDGDGDDGDNGGEDPEPPVPPIDPPVDPGDGDGDGDDGDNGGEDPEPPVPPIDPPVDPGDGDGDGDDGDNGGEDPEPPVPPIDPPVDPGDGDGDGDDGDNGGEDPEPPVPPIDPPVDPGDGDGDGEDTPDDPYVYAKAGLLGADGEHDPGVTVFLLTPDGEKMSAPFPEHITVSGNESYNVLYNSESGTLTITLKDPSAGAAPTENLVIEIDGKTYIIQVGSSETSDLADVLWAPVDDGVAFVDKTWAGSTDKHLTGGMTFVEDQEGKVTLVTPDGYENSELHLQMTDSSLVSTDDKSIAVDLNLKEGSFTLSNNGKTVFDVDHADPIDTARNWYWTEGGYDTSATAYTASVTAALGARGPEARATVNVNGGDVSIHADGGAADSGNGGPVYASGVFAADGGAVSVQADNIAVSASSEGYTDGGTVTGLRAHGAALGPAESEWSPPSVSANSQVYLQADKDVSVAVELTGQNGQNHGNTSYAAVAATERGQVNIQAGGDITISAGNAADADSDVNANGVYGIYSGFGLGKNDLPGLEDFRDAHPGLNWGDQNGDGLNEYDYNQYMQALAYQYAEDRGYWWSEERPDNQSKVSLDAAGDIEVNVDLGSGSFAGNASGVRAVFGDVDISSGGHIDVTVTHDGNSGADGSLSALSVGHAHVSMRAEEDLNLSVKGNGNDLSVVRILPTIHASGSSGYTHLAGKNVTLEGQAGFGGGADNSITGINAGGTTFKKEAFTISADEKATLDVTASHNGGMTHVTGIAVSRSDILYNGYKHDLTVAVDAPQFEINATMKGDASEGDSTATGIKISDGASLSLRSYDSLDEFAGTDYPLYEGKEVKFIEDLRVNVGGARQNTGVGVTKNGTEWNDNAGADIRAKTMAVSVSGGNAADGSSWGLKAWDNSNDYGYGESAKISIQTENLNVAVDDANHSVGLSAQGAGAGIFISSVKEYDQNWNILSSPLTVVIACTVTNKEGQFNGIALEAIRGGQISIVSAQREGTGIQEGLDDTIRIDGDIIAGGRKHGDGYYQSSRILFDTADGDDRVEINGDIKIGKSGDFTVNLGNGDDYFSLTGGISLQEGGHLYIDAGDGDDVIVLDGKVDLGSYTDEHGYHQGGHFSLTGGEGNDLLILKAPDAATFEAWYREWLELDGTLDTLQCETIVVQGVDSMEGLEWLVGMMKNYPDVDFKVVADEMGPNLLGQPSSLSGLLGFDGIEENGEDTPQAMSLAVDQGAMSGLEQLMFDSPSEQSLDTLLSGALEDLIGSGGSSAAQAAGEPHSGTLHQASHGAGGSNGGETHAIQSVDYPASANGAEEQLYLQLMNG